MTAADAEPLGAWADLGAGHYGWTCGRCRITHLGLQTEQAARNGFAAHHCVRHVEPDLGDGLRALVELLEQRIAAADELLFRRRPAGQPYRQLVDEARAILRGD
jgi:hypothetical protein